MKPDYSGEPVEIAVTGRKFPCDVDGRCQECPFGDGLLIDVGTTIWCPRCRHVLGADWQNATRH